MSPNHTLPGLLTFCALSVAGCGEGASSGATGTYVSVVNPELSIALKSGGVLELTLAGVGKSTGTYTLDGEKVLLAWEGQRHTLIRDGVCLEDPQELFDKSCIGGARGEASNTPTRVIPLPAGTWVARSAEGEFRLEFLEGNRLSLSATPPGGAPDVRQGSYTLSGDRVDATVDQVPMVLSFVNGAWETTSFGFPLRFIK
jgi:hypothetical protein